MENCLAYIALKLCKCLYWRACIVTKIWQPSENVGSKISLYNVRIVNLRIPCVRFPPYIIYGTSRLIFSKLGQILKNKAKVTLHPLPLVLSNSDSLSFANKSMLILATPSALPHNHFTLTDIKTIQTLKLVCLYPPHTHTLHEYTNCKLVKEETARKVW